MSLDSLLNRTEAASRPADGTMPSLNWNDLHTPLAGVLAAHSAGEVSTRTAPSEKAPNAAMAHHDGFFATAEKAFLTSAVQAPLTSLLQIGNAMGLVSEKTVDSVKFVKPPQQDNFMSANWFANTIGGGLGTAIPFMLTSSAVDRGLSRLAEFESLAPAMKALHVAPRLGESGSALFALKGATYEALFHPTDSSQNFWSQRLVNSVAGAADFAVMNHISNEWKPSQLSELSMPRRVLSMSTAQALGGVASGITDSVVRPALSGKKTTATDLFQNVVQNAAMGALIGAVREGTTASEKPLPVEKLEEDLSKQPDLDSNHYHLALNDSSYHSVGLDKSNMMMVFEEDGATTPGMPGAPDSTIRYDAEHQLTLHTSNETNANSNASSHAQNERGTTSERAEPGSTDEKTADTLKMTFNDDDPAFQEKFIKSLKIKGQEYLLAKDGHLYKAWREGHQVTVQDAPNMVDIGANHVQTPWVPLDSDKKRQLLNTTISQGPPPLWRHSF